MNIYWAQWELLMNWGNEENKIRSVAMNFEVALVDDARIVTSLNCFRDQTKMMMVWCKIITCSQQIVFYFSSFELIREIIVVENSFSCSSFFVHFDFLVCGKSILALMETTSLWNDEKGKISSYLVSHRKLQYEESGSKECNHFFWYWIHW